MKKLNCQNQTLNTEDVLNATSYSKAYHPTIESVTGVRKISTEDLKWKSMANKLGALEEDLKLINQFIEHRKRL